MINTIIMGTILRMTHGYSNSKLHNSKDDFYGDNSKVRRSLNRNLTVDLSMNDILGSGVSDFQVGEEQTITATPRDSSNNPIVSGVDLFIQISNVCTVLNESTGEVNSDSPAITDTISGLMSYNNDGQSYSYTFTINKAGPISIFINLYEHSLANITHYTDDNFTDYSDTTYWPSVIYFPSDKKGTDFPYDSFIIRTYLKVSSADRIYIKVKYADGIQFERDNVIVTFLDSLSNSYKTNTFSNVGISRDITFDYQIQEGTIFNYYYIKQSSDGFYDRIIWYWKFSANDKYTEIPTENYTFPTTYYDSPYSVSGYGMFGFEPDSNYDCVEVGGNRIKTETEEGDDGNTDDNDGCSSTGMLEEGFDCTFFVEDGYSKVTGLPIGGDGIRVGEEKCDDGDIFDDQGCLSDGSGAIDGWHCSNGSPTQSDTCVERCNDGFITISEEGEQNNNDAGDGCYNCQLEVGWLGENNTELTLTTCSEICGDGLRLGSEVGDDGNTESGDGCSSTGSKIEYRCVGRGGSPTSKDTGEGCKNGWYPDSTTIPEYCVTRGGDGVKAGDERGDDNNDDSYDGCSSECTIEDQHVGIQSTESSSGSCYEGLYLFEPNSELNEGECKNYSMIPLALFCVLIFTITVQIILHLILMCKNGPQYLLQNFNMLTIPITNLHLMISLLALEADLDKTSKELTVLFQYVLFRFDFLQISLKLDMNHSYLSAVGFSSSDIVPNIVNITGVLVLFLLLGLILLILKGICGKNETVLKLYKQKYALILAAFLQITFTFVLIASFSILFNSKSTTDLFAFLSYFMVIIWIVLQIIIVLRLHHNKTETRNTDYSSSVNHHPDFIFDYQATSNEAIRTDFDKDSLKKIIYDVYKIGKIVIFGFFCCIYPSIKSNHVLIILVLIHVSEITISRSYMIFSSKLSRTLTMLTDICLLGVLVIFWILSTSSDHTTDLSLAYIFVIISTYLMQLIIVIKYLCVKKPEIPHNNSEANITGNKLNVEESKVIEDEIGVNPYEGN